MADYKAKQFFGTAQQVFNYSTADISAGNFSPAGSNFDNTIDSSVPYADRMMCVLECSYAAAPTEGQTVDLYALMLNIDGTSDETGPPSGISSNGSHYLGSWILDNATGLQRGWMICNVTGITGFVPYIKNSSSTDMDCAGGSSPLIVKITPFVVGAAG